MVPVEVSVLIVAARQAATRAGIRALSRRFRKPELKELASVFAEACRTADERLDSAMGEAVSLELGSQEAVAKFIQLVVTAALTDDLGEVCSAIAEVSHERLDFGYSDVSSMDWLTEMASACESILQDRATSADSPIYNWYSTIASHADRVVLRRLSSEVAQHRPTPAALGPGTTLQPEQPPQLFRLPAAINRRATGRANDLERLEASLRDDPVLVLRGLGGVGKTQLTVRFATDHAHRYDVVWTLSGDTHEQMRLSLYGLGRALGVVGADDPIDRALNAVERWRNLSRPMRQVVAMRF